MRETIRIRTASDWMGKEEELRTLGSQGTRSRGTFSLTLNDQGTLPATGKSLNSGEIFEKAGRERIPWLSNVNAAFFEVPGGVEKKRKVLKDARAGDNYRPLL